MCIDPGSAYVYLFGGWDGRSELGDFWRYSILTNRWVQLSANTEDDNGPDARSCHKMVLDPVNQKLFVLGKYADIRNPEEQPKNELYCYFIKEGKWRCLMYDTAAAGGPDLIYDHQMCFNADANAIYVFGGRKIVQGESADVYCVRVCLLLVVVVVSVCVCHDAVLREIRCTAHEDSYQGLGWHRMQEQSTPSCFPDCIGTTAAPTRGRCYERTVQSVMRMWNSRRGSATRCCMTVVRAHC
jgi:hypothetical protein